MRTRRFAMVPLFTYLHSFKIDCGHIVRSVAFAITLILSAWDQYVSHGPWRLQGASPSARKVKLVQQKNIIISPAISAESANTLAGRLSRRAVLLGGAAIVAMPALAVAQSAGTQNAWDMISNNPDFSDATRLFTYAGLEQYVQNDRFTAFIPTNAAFAKNPTVLPGLLKEKSRAFPDTTLAVEFIRSHAIYDLHPLSDFKGKKAVLTAISGAPLTIDGTTPGTYVVTWVSVQSKIATAHITDNPIVTANALIYPVDTVVLADPKE
jgi:uncharacterized surface protein with fasciclin (FAS1) repeats